MKINVLTVNLTVHIPLNPGSIDSIQHAASGATALHAHAAELGQATVETRLARVTAPEPAQEAPVGTSSSAEPEPAADDLAIPAHLVRTKTA